MDSLERPGTSMLLNNERKVHFSNSSDSLDEIPVVPVLTENVDNPENFVPPVLFTPPNTSTPADYTAAAPRRSTRLRKLTNYWGFSRRD